MLTPKLKAELNNQIKHETASAFAYAAMESYFQTQSLSGFAHFFRLQGKEELNHASKFVEFLFDRGEGVTYQTIEAPKAEFTSVPEIFDAALKHEQFITSRINLLMDLAIAEKDYPTQSFLKWFVDEQVEEEQNMQTIIDQLKLSGGHGGALLMLDHRLGKRE